MKNLTIVVTLMISFILFSCKNRYAQWEGTIEVREGVTVVTNPKEPLYKESILTLEKDLEISDVEANQEEFVFANLSCIAVDGEGNIYVSDQQACRIFIFNKSGALSKSFGHRGQGPGEMALPFSISITPQNELMLNDWMLRRITFYTLDGSFVRQIGSAKYLFLRTKSDQEMNLIGSYIIPGPSPRIILEKFSSDLKVLLELGEESMSQPPEMNAFAPHFFWEVFADGCILWGNIYTYKLHQVDSDGQLIRIIHKDFNPVKTPDEAEENWIDEINWDYIPPFVDSKVVVPDTYPPYLTFSVDERGRIFVRTFEKDHQGQILYDIFDSEGRCIAKTALNIPALEPRKHVWKNSHLFMISTDGDGYQSIHRYRIRWRGLASKT